MVVQLTESILGQLEYTLSLVAGTVNSDDLAKITDAQSNYCMLLQSAFSRLQESASSIADRAMTIFLSLLNSSICSKDASLHEDVLMAIEALFAISEKERCTSYFTYFYPKLVEVITAGRSNNGAAAGPRDSTLVSVAIGIVGELFRLLPKDVVSGCSLDIIPSLLEVMNVSMTWLRVRTNLLTRMLKSQQLVPLGM